MDTTDTTVRENDNEEPLDMTQTNYCLRHSKTETNLRCGRCEEYICPECMVQTPVGFRCPDCGKARRVPTYDVTPLFLTRGIAAGLAISVALGVALGLLVRLLIEVPEVPLLRFLPLVGVVGIGYLIGEGISLAVNRKMGRSLKFVAAGSMLVSYLTIISTFSFLGIAPLFEILFVSLFGILALVGAFYVSLRRF